MSVYFAFMLIVKRIVLCEFFAPPSCGFHAVVVQITRPFLDCVFGGTFMCFFSTLHIAMLFSQRLFLVHA
jgi:hypothetical protein